MISCLLKLGVISLFYRVQLTLYCTFTYIVRGQYAFTQHFSMFNNSSRDKLLLRGQGPRLWVGGHHSKLMGLGKKKTESERKKGGDPSASRREKRKTYTGIYTYYREICRNGLSRRKQQYNLMSNKCKASLHLCCSRGKWAQPQDNHIHLPRHVILCRVIPTQNIHYVITSQNIRCSHINASSGCAVVICASFSYPSQTTMINTVYRIVFGCISVLDQIRWIWNGR